MTAPASDPDGTDPRILSPSDDEPTVTIAHGHSTGKTFHTTECPVVRRMNAPNEVAQSVAEWKGYTKCKRCDEREGGDGFPHPGGPDGPGVCHHLQGVTRAECLQIRVRLLTGGSRRTVQEALDIGNATVGRHVSGDCSCQHHAHTLTYDTGAGEYRVADDRGVPTDAAGRVQIDAPTCAVVRSALPLAGVSTRTLGTVLGISAKSVRHHATGACDHTHDTTAVAWDADERAWHSTAPDPPTTPADRDAGVSDD